MIAFRPGVSPASVVQLLNQVRADLVSVSGTRSQAADRLRGWREWSSNATRILRPAFTDDGLRQHILGSRYDVLQTVIPATYGDELHALIDLEIQIRLQDLSELAGSINRDWQTWGNGQAKAFILDTNILIDFAERIELANWHLLGLEMQTTNLWLVIPIQVVEELDTLKDRHDKAIPPRARQALHWLETKFGKGWNTSPLDEIAGVPTRPIRLHLLIDELDRVPLPRHDADILNRAQSIEPYVKSVTVVSQDYSMRFRAEALGFQAMPLQRKDVHESAEAVAARRAGR